METAIKNNDLTTIEKLITESLSFAARRAVYRGENPTAAVGNILLTFEEMLPKATITAFQESIATEAKMLDARGIDADRVKRDAEKLSKMANDLASDIMLVNSELSKALGNTVVQQNEVNKRMHSQEDIFQKFNINAGAAAVVESDKKAGKENKLGM